MINASFNSLTRAIPSSISSFLPPRCRRRPFCFHLSVDPDKPNLQRSTEFHAPISQILELYAYLFFHDLDFVDYRMEDMAKPNNFLHNLIKIFSKCGPSREGQSKDDLERIAAQEQRFFAFETLVSATKNFHRSHKLGEGGFGPVYKRKLDDGREITVKKLSQRSNQVREEFLNEAKSLARVRHQNFVNLLGYCAHGIQMLLVYEYMIYGSLNMILFESNRRVELDWKRRFDIINGIAWRLLCLHEDSINCMVHRDIKAGNILLDDKWVPKIRLLRVIKLFVAVNLFIDFFLFIKLLK